MKQLFSVDIQSVVKQHITLCELQTESEHITGRYIRLALNDRNEMNQKIHAYLLKLKLVKKVLVH